MAGLIMYNENFKRKVVREVRMGLISKEEARRKYSIGGHSTILNDCQFTPTHCPQFCKACPLFQN